MMLTAFVLSAAPTHAWLQLPMNVLLMAIVLLGLVLKMDFTVMVAMMDMNYLMLENVYLLTPLIHQLEEMIVKTLLTDQLEDINA